MALTPNEVANKQFGRQVRGYAIDEVDDFLDTVEAELVRLLTENGKLQQRLTAAGTTPAPVAAAPTAPVAEAVETQEAALRTLLMAQRTADQAVAEARAEADQILADAKERAARSDQEVNARVASAMARLDADRQSVETKVAELKAFEREYRVRLKAYLEGQLRDLEQRGGGEGAGAGVPAAARTAAVGPMPPGVTDAGAARPPAPAPAVPPVVPVPPTAVPPTAVPPAAAPPTAVPPGPSGPPREAGTPTVGPFTTPKRSPFEQVDEGPEPPAAP